MWWWLAALVFLGPVGFALGWWVGGRLRPRVYQTQRGGSGTVQIQIGEQPLKAPKERECNG